MTPSEAQGGCLCGRITFRVDLPSLWCAHCHCTQCRTAHGAAFVTWLGVREDAFHLTGGGEAFRRYESSPGVERGFCERCGSTFFFRSTRWPGEVHLTLASFSTPVDRGPEGNAYEEERVAWAELPAEKGGNA